MENVEMVSLAAYESQGSRFMRIIRWLVLGWTLSMVAWGLAFVICTSYAEEVVTETTETVTQDSGDNGSNHYIGGDMNGDPNYYENSFNNQDDETGSSVPDTDQPA